MNTERNAIYHDPDHRDGSDLVEAMLRPEMYPERPPKVELRQTHISYAFLAGDSVYKIKKPVSFSFVDASTLARRFRLCQAEVRLNRRLASDVYLRVVPIVRCNGRLKLAELGTDDGTIVEYAVKMRRLNDAAMLDRMLAARNVSIAQIRAIAARVAAFHAASRERCGEEERAAKAWRHGSAAAVWRLVHGNLTETQEACAGLVSREEISEMQRFVRRFGEVRWSLLDQRALCGYVCEGHGDLRCEHVSLEDNRIRIIDCIEFNEGLRWLDVASDVAFLAMDLDRLDAEELSDQFVAAYREASGDGDLGQLMPFHKIHRALVRAKVAGLTSKDSEVDEVGRHAAAGAARNYLTLALNYAREARPALMVVCGMSGTGKSTLACLLQNRVGFDLLRSDMVRKRLMGVDPTTRVSTEYGTGPYSREFTERTYATLLDEIAAHLGQGAGVIADATFAAVAERARVSELAARAGVPILFVECTANEREVLRRLEIRTTRADEVSDAGAAVYLRQRATFAPLAEISERSRVSIDTTHGVDAAMRAIRRRLVELH